MNNVIRIGLSAILLCSWEVSAAGVYEDMIEAVQKNDSVTVKQLIGRGVDPSTTDPGGNSLLMLAAKAGSVKAMDTLLAARSEVNAQNALGESALMFASLRGQLDEVKLLLGAGANVNQSGWTPLMYAAVSGDVEIARLLISKGADVNATAANGFTALMMAVREGRRDLVAFLLANGADPNLKTDAGISALALAHTGKADSISDALVKAGAQAE